MKLNIVVFGLLINLFTVCAQATSSQQSWSRIDVQPAQVTQIEAGLPKGCLLTTVFYALKFGPNSWRNAYENLPGNSDAKKIKSIATKFSAQPSKNSKGQPIFSEKYGGNPNDVPQMFKSLVQDTAAVSQKDYFIPKQANALQRYEFLRKLHFDLYVRLSLGYPVPLALYFLNPEGSHSVLITGVQNSIDQNGTIKILILDPLTGKVSSAVLKLESFPLFNGQLEAFSFSDLDVADRTGFVFSLSL